ncbi:hypothetical protein [Corynebacterium aquatimens]|uniref:Uncharacterized protein n=1 Tax=Corynebacterium aquatimens TaxID=1190508 RepID=A0A931DYC8_9CORY|nr:hypothetical protein [Corynebacterium aquatimens]MBG6122612.1 hypothetical protein [Corynebacterium aquatimens]WJY64848.1 hypothetical protein CAQUA_00500 [Corynebacterium aquatimens]
MQIASFTIHYTPSEDDYYYDNDEVWAAYYDLYPDEDVDFETFIEDNPEFGTYTGESFPVGIITFDPSDGKRVTKLLDPYSIEAPEWYSDYIACDIEEIIDEFFKSDGPGLFDEEGRCCPTWDIELTVNRPLSAANFEAALDRLMDTFVTRALNHEHRLYETFTLDFRTNIKKDEHLPIAVFAYCAPTGEFSAEWLIDDNPFAPPKLNRAQRKHIQRQTDEFMANMTAENIQIAFNNIRRPQFGIYRVDSYPALSSGQAVDMALADLKELWSTRKAA